MTRPTQTNKRFSKQVLAAIQAAHVVGIRAGPAPHRFIGIWAVVVEGRVFVRSWSLKPRSWYRTLLSSRAAPCRSASAPSPCARLKAAVSRAYLDKYNSPGSIKYARDPGRAKSKATTIELVPIQ